ncbi:MAG: DUF3107 domain-containing protein [Actinomycetota bacterium]
MIEVRIGIVDVTKELSIELEETPERAVELVNAALRGDTDLLWLMDKKGTQIGVPSAKIAYVEVTSAGGGRAVGFGATP